MSKVENINMETNSGKGDIMVEQTNGISVVATNAIEANNIEKKKEEKKQERENSTFIKKPELLKQVEKNGPINDIPLPKGGFTGTSGIGCVGKVVTQEEKERLQALQHAENVKIDNARKDKALENMTDKERAKNVGMMNVPVGSEDSIEKRRKVRNYKRDFDKRLAMINSETDEVYLDRIKDMSVEDLEIEREVAMKAGRSKCFSRCTSLIGNAKHTANENAKLSTMVNVDGVEIELNHASARKNNDVGREKERQKARDLNRPNVKKREDGEKPKFTAEYNETKAYISDISTGTYTPNQTDEEIVMAGQAVMKIEEMFGGDKLDDMLKSVLRDGTVSLSDIKAVKKKLMDTLKESYSVKKEVVKKEPDVEMFDDYSSITDDMTQEEVFKEQAKIRANRMKRSSEFEKNVLSDNMERAREMRNSFTADEHNVRRFIESEIMFANSLRNSIDLDLIRDATSTLLNISTDMISSLILADIANQNLRIGKSMHMVYQKLDLLISERDNKGLTTPMFNSLAAIVRKKIEEPDVKPTILSALLTSATKGNANTFDYYARQSANTPHAIAMYSEDALSASSVTVIMNMLDTHEKAEEYIQNAMDDVLKQYNRYEYSMVLNEMGLGVAKSSSNDEFVNVVTGAITELEKIYSIARRFEMDKSGDVMIDFNTVTEAEINKLEAEGNDKFYYKTGFSFVNDTNNGGVRSGDLVVTGALSSNYKTGMSMSIFISIMLNNMAPDMGDKKAYAIWMSFEDDYFLVVEQMFQIAYFNVYRRYPVLEKWNTFKRMEFLTKEVAKRGWSMHIGRYDPSDFTALDVQSQIEYVEGVDGRCMVAALDYIDKLSTAGMDKAIAGADKREITSRLRNYFSKRNCTLISPWQLSAAAGRRLIEGIAPEDFMDEVMGKPYYQGVSTLATEIDLELFTHKIKGDEYTPDVLSMGRGKSKAGKVTINVPLKAYYPFVTDGPVEMDVVSRIEDGKLVLEEYKHYARSISGIDDAIDKKARSNINKVVVDGMVFDKRQGNIGLDKDDVISNTKPINKVDNGAFDVKAHLRERAIEEKKLEETYEKKEVFTRVKPVVEDRQVEEVKPTNGFVDDDVSNEDYDEDGAIVTKKKRVGVVNAYAPKTIY